MYKLYSRKQGYNEMILVSRFNENYNIYVNDNDHFIEIANSVTEWEMTLIVSTQLRWEGYTDSFICRSKYYRIALNRDTKIPEYITESKLIICCDITSALKEILKLAEILVPPCFKPDIR